MSVPSGRTAGVRAGARGQGPKRIALVLTSGIADETTATALRLAERLLARGQRVSVFAHEEAAALSASGGQTAAAIAELVRAGVHGASLQWVVDDQGTERLGCAGQQVPGVVPGDHSDLWSFIRDADLVLSPGRP